MVLTHNPLSSLPALLNSLIHSGFYRVVEIYIVSAHCGYHCLARVKLDISNALNTRNSASAEEKTLQ